MDNASIDIRSVVRNLVGVVIIIVLFAALFWVWGHSYIHIDGSAYSGQKKYTIIDDDGKTIASSRSTGDMKKLVKKGDYQVLVEQPEKSALKHVKAPGLLRTARVTPRLLEEKSRSFVGNNPGPCMYYLQDALYSSSCFARSSDLMKHLPAKGFTPSYATKANLGLIGELHGIATTARGSSVALFYDPIEDITSYHLKEVAPNKDSPRIAARNLDIGKKYSIASYLDGFLVYDTDAAEYYYYASTGAEPKKIVLDKPKTKQLTAAQTIVQRNAIVSLYTDGAMDETAPDNKNRGEEATGTSEIILHQSTSQRHITLPYSYRAAAICGDKTLCAIGQKGATVYDISGKKPRSLYSLSGIKDVFPAGQDGIKFVTARGILSYDPVTESGSFDYTLGNYTTCGSAQIVSEDTYLLCLVNSRKDRVALLIQDSPVSSTGPIDKNIGVLLRSSYISVVSAYKNNIIIAPNYDSGTSLDPSIKKWINDNVQSAIQKSDLDPAVYTINTIGSP